MEPSTVPIPTTVLAHNIGVLPDSVVCLAVSLHELVQAKGIMWACSRSHGFVDWRNGLRIKSLPSAHKRFIKHHLFFLSLAPLYTYSWPKQVCLAHGPQARKGSRSETNDASTVINLLNMQFFIFLKLICADLRYEFCRRQHGVAMSEGWRCEESLHPRSHPLPRRQYFQLSLLVF